MARIERMKVWEPKRAAVGIATDPPRRPTNEPELWLNYQQAHSLFLELGSYLMSTRNSRRLTEAITVLTAYHEDRADETKPWYRYEQWIEDETNSTMKDLVEHYLDGENWPTGRFSDPHR